MRKIIHRRSLRLLTAHSSEMKIFAVPFAYKDDVWYCTKMAEAGGRSLVRVCTKTGDRIKYQKHYTVDSRCLTPVKKMSPERRTEASKYLKVILRGDKLQKTGKKMRARTPRASPASPSRFPYVERKTDDTRQDINSFFAKSVKAYHDNVGTEVRVLVLDHPSTMATSHALVAQQIEHLKIDWVNDEVAEMRKKKMKIASVPGVITTEGKVGDFLKDLSDQDLFDAMFLDYCGQLESFKPDIRTAMSRLWLGRHNQGAVFGVTFMFSRGGDSKEEILAWIEAVATKLQLQACLMKSWLHGSHFTAFWNVRRIVSEL